ncbi:unnamed protein product [Diabrotica balteata]|uniref:Ciliary BBSome complex subunit 2 C-terminal domain-containing protein n=1 Tax=Diabrotica balteata TaxID=107213 RepID=A0A9N9T6F7_DIABA|nr:unnamed protein product [Diabrotica balteata]
MYSLKEVGRNSRSESYVEFKITERLQRICMWINQNFLLPNDIEFDSGPNLTLSLRCLRNDTDLDIVFEISGKITIYTSNISLAADIIQSIAAYLNIGNLESSASFPQEEEKVSTLMGKLQDIQNARLRLETDVADRTSQIRALIVQADDCRINNLNALPDQYKELMTINAELINGYNIRLQNYNEGVETMKTLNSIIQKASRLRVGSKSSNMINFCRTCLNNNSAEGLLKVIKTGEM